MRNKLSNSQSNADNIIKLFTTLLNIINDFVIDLDLMKMPVYHQIHISFQF